MPYTFKHGDRPLDDFTIQRAVGTGGFGEVYYAMSDGGREVALKYLKANPEIELRGVSNCINLKSPHLVSIFDVKKNAEGEYFIVMEYCSGPSLRDLLIAEPNGFGPQKAAFFVREIAKGLSYLHDRGIVHRDLKPGNIFFDDGYVKIGDYGLSKFISVSRHSAQTASIGTVHYMAPEIGSGNYSRGVDIYALGVMLYEMLLGKVPFDGSTMAEVLMKHLTSRPELEALPEPFTRVIRKTLEKDPRDRYPNVNEMVDDLLTVDQVRESLAGFSLQSLGDAVRRGAPDRAASPMPSPNPPPAGIRPLEGGGLAGMGGGAILPDRLAKRMEQITRKIDKKIAKLSGEKSRRRGVKDHHVGPPPLPQAARNFGDSSPAVQVGPAAAYLPAASTHELRKRMLLSLLIAAGIASLIGTVAGLNTGHAEVGVSFFLMILGTSIGTGVAAQGIRWFGAEEGPGWVRRTITTGCCAVPLLLGSLPIHAVGWTDTALALFYALTIHAALGDRSAPLRRPQDAELRLGSAIGTGLFALLIGAVIGGIMDLHDREQTFAMLGAGSIATAVSIIVQINAWWLGVGMQHRRRWSAFPTAPVAAPAPIDGNIQVPMPPGAPAAGIPVQNESAEPNKDWGPLRAAQTVAQAAMNQELEAASRTEIDDQASLERWGVTRGFWGLVAFVAMCVVVISSISLGMLKQIHEDEATAMILAIVGGGLVALFALRKTTPTRRPGFWRETFRPVILTTLAFLIGGLITGISRYWTCGTVGDEGRVAMVSGLVICSIAWLAMLFFTGGRPRRPRPFLTEAKTPVVAQGAAGVNAEKSAGLSVAAPRDESV